MLDYAHFSLIIPLRRALNGLPCIKYVADSCTRAGGIELL